MLTSALGVILMTIKDILNTRIVPYLHVLLLLIGHLGQNAIKHALVAVLEHDQKLVYVKPIGEELSLKVIAVMAGELWNKNAIHRVVQD